MSDFYPINQVGTRVRTLKASAAAPSLSEGDLTLGSCDLSGNLRVTGGGGGGGGGAVTVADGADVTQGAIADAAVATDATGTVNAHLRGLVKLLASCISIGSSWMQVSIQNATLAVTQSLTAAPATPGYVSLISVGTGAYVNITTNIATSTVTIVEDGENPTTAFKVRRPGSGTNTSTYGTGRSYTFSAPPGTRFAASQTVGSVETVTGTVNFIQDEQ